MTNRLDAMAGNCRVEIRVSAILRKQGEGCQIRSQNQNPTDRKYRGFAGAAAVLVSAAGVAAAPAAAGPLDRYIDKYGPEICEALDRNPSSDEVVRAVVGVQGYLGLSIEDATSVVTDSVSRVCPQHLELTVPNSNPLND